ncbi:MAG TPA: CRISPR-associated endonuclease Cas2 [Thermosynechococcus sp. M98_K2018_005]|nr:CRISPR-associated endonuclease Cas2 [Thermosynechococcus sp. M98_K2018_005]HIK48464.1 CRISPR-associated endonuclease Cas2 [Thermosynechococcus sp. M55_K2018_012]
MVQSIILNKVAELLEGYGRRIQFSVFEARLETYQVEQLGDRLQRRIKRSGDHIRIYPLSRPTEARILVLGSGQIPVEFPFSTVVGAL